MDLGIKETAPTPSAVAPSSEEKKEPKVNYPSFDVRDEHADEIREERECEVGVEGEAKIKFRLTGNSKDNYSNRLTFDVLSMDITSYGDESEDDEKEEKALGYKRPKKEKENPSMDAKDLY